MKLDPSIPSFRKSPGHTRDKAASPAGSDMKEKYFHSLGALLLEERRFDEAISAFLSALALKDTSYSRYDLGKAYLAGGRLADAVIELSRAIELCPSAPEYWHERGLAFEHSGDHERAAADFAEAKRIDPDYGRIDEIRSAVRAIEIGLCDPAMEEFCDTAAPKDPELRSIIEDLKESLGIKRDVLDRSSCPVGTCPVYCCHFTEATVCHGLTIGAWKLHSIRIYLEEQGLDPGDFIDRLSFHREEHLRSLVPPNYILTEGKERFIFFPKRKAGAIAGTDLEDLPRGRDCRTLMWINAAARPCAFLSGKRCMIHDAGGEASLEACKQFLCLTGFAFVILGHLGIVNEAAIPAKPMAELNRLAVESLLLLSRALYGREDFAGLNRALLDTLRAAWAADNAGNRSGIRARASELQKLKRELGEMTADSTRRAARDIAELFADACR